MRRWCATYYWKALNKGYNFSLDLIQSEVYTQSYGAPKSRESQLWEFRNFDLGNESLETKCHLDVGLMERYKVYYKGEGGGFLQVRAMVSLMSPNTKNASTMH
jgi:hypothetical protein